MTTVAAPLAEPELQGFTPVETDLDQQGRLGLSRLEVVDGHLRRIEQTLSGDFVALDVPVNALSEIRTEDLVDAIALVAQHDGRTLELIRASTRRAGVFSSAQRQLAALVKGEPVPPPDSLEGTCPKCGRPLGGNSNVCEACLDRGQTLKRLFSYTLPFRGRMAWGVALSIFGMAFELLPPYLTKLLFDEGLGQKNFKFFVLVILMLLGSRIFATALQIARGRNVAWLGMMISRSIRHSLFEKLQRLSLSFYDKRNVGSLMSRMTNDTSALYDVLVDGIPVVVNQALLLIFIPAAILLLNWKIGLIAILPIPFVLFAVNRFRRKMNRVWNRVHHQNSRLSGTLNGILQGTRVVKAFHGEDREVLRFNRRVTALTDASYLAENSWATFFPLVVLTMGLSIILVYFVGGKAVLDDSITIGSLVAFVAYVQRLNEPLMMLQRLIDWSTRALTAAERVFEILDTPIDVQDSAQAIPMPEIQGRVSLKDVHFGYEKSREILHGLNFEASPGEMIGVVGPSGSGKTTLISLLLRFYDPTSGRIELDGVDLREIQLEDFRRQVGVVLQESYLFPGSVRDNIVYGRPDATLEEVIAAAQAANAHKFIVGFPDGYDTHVGERGQRLSGGERQRIAIARAILHNPKVLILDEATASVDTETEQMIQEAIDHLVEGRTVFAIAHRLSTLRHADRLLVVDEGRIAEVGTHDELLAKPDGIYRRLVNMQAEVAKIQENRIGAEEEDEDEEEEAPANATL